MRDGKLSEMEAFVFIQVLLKRMWNLGAQPHQIDELIGQQCKRFNIEHRVGALQRWYGGVVDADYLWHSLVSWGKGNPA